LRCQIAARSRRRSGVGSSMLVAETFRDREKSLRMSKGPIGNVHSVSGSQVSVGLVGGQPGGLYEAGITVGKFVKIQSGKAPIVGVIAEVSIQAPLRIRE